MTRNQFVGCALFFALASLAGAQEAASPAGKSVQYTQAQVKQLIPSAHTPEQYQTLASYYGDRQKSYLQKAAEEKQEWKQLSQNSISMAAKYPRPADSARNRYEYYMNKASKEGTLSAKYEQLAMPDHPVNAQ